MTGRTEERVIQAQTDALEAIVDRGFSELKIMLRSYEERLRELEKLEAGYQPLLLSRMDAAWRKLDSHEIELADQRKSSSELAAAVDKLNGVSKWILGIVTALIVAFLIAFLTGRIDIVLR